MYVTPWQYWIPACAGMMGCLGLVEKPGRSRRRFFTSAGAEGKGRKGSSRLRNRLPKLYPLFTPRLRNCGQIKSVGIMWRQIDDMLWRVALRLSMVLEDTLRC
jgi:hypothetical protein